MNGAESLVKTLVNAGVEVCFTNPGTSEIHFVAALDRVEGMRAILGLFEGVVTGAADGYGRMAEKPAATLLHLGPGLANGGANLHNAHKANTPLVNIIGEHATYHQQYNAPLHTDIKGLAEPLSHWVDCCTSSDEIAFYGQQAVQQAMTAPGKVASLILPADVSWNENTNGPVDCPPIPRQIETVPEATIALLAQVLNEDQTTVILMTGQALSEQGLALGNQIANSCDASLCCELFSAKLARGVGRAKIERLPYFGEKVIERLASVKHLILVGCSAPVAFFAYPNAESNLVPSDCNVHTLATPEQDAIKALQDLALATHASADNIQYYAPHTPELPSGDLNMSSLATTFAALLPENAIISDEANTSGAFLFPMSQGCPKHDWLSLTGGAIGQGLPVALGAAVACPDRKVISMQADGSAMYTIQSLWTIARENLDVTVVILANRSYAILQIEFARLGAGAPGNKSKSLLDLSNPNLDFVSIAQGMGINASQASSAEEFNEQFAEAMNNHGPRLIEAIL
ncbi:MAG: acetolactate synthase large subunit [Gammaproteobacteria bacterium]|nr:MAG: acetolactate synthase large subunit [Gammaproteobacteria bacterium]